MKLLALLLLAVGAVAVAGCGGGDDDTATASLTKAEYVKQANAICAKHQREMGKKFEEFLKKENAGEKNPDPKAFEEAVADVAIPALEGQIDELSELPAPAGEEETVELIIERQEESLEKTEEDPSFRSADGPYQQLNKPARDYGLTECAA